MKKSTLKTYLLENAEELKSVVQELNSWNGSLDYLRVEENYEDFFNTFFESPLEAVRASQYGEYNFNDDLVRFNGYGNLDSLSYMDYEEELVANIDEIIENLEDNKENLYLSDELTEILNEEEDEEIEEES